MRIFLLLLVFAFPAFAEPPDRQCNTGQWGNIWCIRTEHRVFDTCQALRDAAQTHALNPDFLTRLIWQESRFDPNALSPAGAQGIAQFMPQTAALRRLSAPFNPALALDHSANYLSKLQNRYGNVGLASIAYNGGERRASAFVAKTAGLATETINYVQIITGFTAEDWRDQPPKDHDLRLDKSKPFMSACLELAKSSRISALKSPRPKPKYKPWGMQMATDDTSDKATSSYNRNSRSCSAEIGKKKPDIIKKSPQVAGRRAYYVARLSFDTRGAAQQFCNRIRKFNCVCAVYKN
jgi:hypothetical protein